MCRNFFPGISGGVLTPLTPPLDPPLPRAPPGQSNETYFFRLVGMAREQISMFKQGELMSHGVHLAAILDVVIRELRKIIISITFAIKQNQI